MTQRVADPGASAGTSFALRVGAARIVSSVPLRHDVIPSVGAVILDDLGRPHTLASEIGSGGEGSVYRTSTGLACKVFAPSRWTPTLLAKLELMLRRPPRVPGVCWPLSLARRAGDTPVGYLMAAARGRELQKTIFIKPLLAAAFPDWDRRHLALVTVTILRRIIEIHRHGVLVGDVNPRNILVESADSVFFVDVDSYQVEDFTCPVGTPPFLHPDLLGRDLGTVLRTPAHEAFAVATLVFMLLLPGKPPYSHTGGGDPIANVRLGHFPYRLGETPTRGAPDGPWRFMWSWLPRRLREAFHAVFADGRVIHPEGWLKLVEDYRGMLEDGRLGREIYPRCFRQLSRVDVERRGGTWTKCSRCGAEFGELESRGGPAVCPTCVPANITQSCQDCGGTFVFHGREQLLFRERGFSAPKRCPDCRKRKRVSGGAGAARFGASGGSALEAKLVLLKLLRGW